ncbi:MAG: hypothetical protein LBP25_00920 [Tannerellaceae bacterium]|jgi:hypothetical protein|nr:hypothetical protein [Tannerellaceae bacterium]
MAKYTIEESNMVFIADTYDTYYIEQSPAYSGIGNRIKTVEFIRRKDNRLLFVEAKSTVASPGSPESFQSQISDICDKFVHSLSLLSAIKIGAVSEILPLYLNYTGNVSLKFVLVIRNHEEKWCRPVKRAIEQTLPVHISKIWKPEVLVINQKTAQKHNIVES